MGVERILQCLRSLGAENDPVVDAEFFRMYNETFGEPLRKVVTFPEPNI